MVRQRELALSYGQIGWTHELLELWPEALSDYSRALAIFQALRKSGPEALLAGRNTANTQERIATVRLRAGRDRAAGLRAYRDAIETWRQVIGLGPSDLQLRYEVIMCLYRFSFVTDGPEAKAAITAAISIAGTLGAQGGSVRDMLEKQRVRLP